MLAGSGRPVTTFAADRQRAARSGMSTLRQWLVAAAVAGLGAGVVAFWTADGDIASLLWSAGTLPILAALLVEIVISLRRGSIGLDLIAALSMSAALLFGESLAANVVALMYAGGQLLEQFAEGRARREMTALLDRVSRVALRKVDGRLEEVPVEHLLPGDRLFIRNGETLPVDGEVLSVAGAVLDESTLTGESLPVTRILGDMALSGSSNAGDAFDLSVSRPAAESTYAQIVKLVQTAQDSKAPVVRAADRLAIWFLLLTISVAGIAWWLSGDHLRALAVLVVATPCPLILALPVALISGMSKAARLGVLIKNGGALEALSRVRTVILDKTGTLTHGSARIAEIRTVDGWAADEVLRLAASLDQASHHVVAEALVTEARRRGLSLIAPAGVVEDAGTGISGQVGDREVIAGGSRYVASRVAGDPYGLREGVGCDASIVAVGIDAKLAGIIVLHDPLRAEAALLLAGFRGAGISRIVLASGDRQDVVNAVAQDLDLDIALGDLSPLEKLLLVQREVAAGATMMVGDGVNDAPALASATIGVAMGARGSAASSQSAGVVILVDQIDRVLRAVEIAGRTRRIAVESVTGGLLLSFVGMLAAALGYLPPVTGALVQEAIDVAVILNALRALR